MAPHAKGWRRGLELGCAAAAMACVVWFFHWTIAANHGFEDWGDLDYYKLLVRGWRKGQLALDKAPSPELLALADPYDPAQNGPHRLGDASLYRGKYYLYFGPAPALTLMLPYSLLTGREMLTGRAIFIFVTVAFLAASGLWLALRRRYFPGSRIIMAPLGVLAIGLGTHLLALAQRPMFWELSIAGGIAFTTLAVVAAYRAMHGPRPVLAMVAAGICLGLAVGSRPTCLFASGLLLAPLWLAWREPKPRRTVVRMALGAALALGACGLAIMAHNHARFENPFEWGQNYQLSGAYEGKLTHFSLRFLPHDFAVYMFQLLEWTPEFPFVQAIGIEANRPPGHFGTEEVAGLAVTFPFVWFALALPLAWARRDPADTRALGAAVAAIAAYGIPVMALVMCYFSTTTRYQADFAVPVALLALTGMLSLERWAARSNPAGAAAPVQGEANARAATRSRRRRRTVAALALFLCGSTVAMGVLVSFDYHGRALQSAAPRPWQLMERRTSHALGEIGRRLGQVPGPRVLKVRFRQQPTGTIETFWQAADPRAGERILVEHIGDHLIRFGYARGADALQWGRPLRWDTDHTHTVSVQLPSLYPEDSYPDWGGLRRRFGFRMRTSAGLWFSGGSALGVVVPPLPAAVEPGGGVGEDFTGEVRRIFSRLFRENEIPSGLVDPHAPPGGVLRMRVVFPPRLHEKGEPLFAAGAQYRSNIVYVRAAEGGIKFVFENFGQNPIESAVVAPNPAGHILELEMASFRPDAYGVEATGDVILRLDGRELLRTRQVAYPFPWGEEAIGHNPFGTTCGPEFRGWITDARWIRGAVRRP